MSRALILSLLLALTACGPPDSCDPAKRSGTYELESDEISGDCGPLDTTLVRLEPGADPGSNGCSLLAADRLSEGNCTLERSIACPSGTGNRILATAITTQMDDSGDVIEGKINYIIEDNSGRQLCHSLYDVIFERQ